MSLSFVRGCGWRWGREKQVPSPSYASHGGFDTSCPKVSGFPFFPYFSGLLNACISPHLCIFAITQYPIFKVPGGQRRSTAFSIENHFFLRGPIVHTKGRRQTPIELLVTYAFLLCLVIIKLGADVSFIFYL